MGQRFLSVLSMVLLLGVVLAACGSGDEDEADPTVTRIPNPPNAPVLSPTPGGEGTAEAGSPVALDGTAVAGSPVAGSPAAGESPVAVEPSGDTLVIASNDVFFEPTELTIAASSDVTISLPNEGAAPHNFSIDELDISVDQAPGETQEVTINAPAGTYEYYCNVPGHKEAGMVGTLTIE